MNCILLRYGEIGLKSKGTRLYFEKLYTRAIKEALERNGITKFILKNLGGRYIVETSENFALEVLRKVPGIESVSPAVKIKFNDKNDLLETLREFSGLAEGKKYAVKAKRVGKHEFTSQELAKEAAGIFYEKSNGVDLSDPEITINLEIRNKECFLYTENLMGIGGLPAGSGGKVLALFSGGIDSPVAAMQMLKRGCKVDFMLVDLLGEKTGNDVLDIYNYLINQYAYNYKPKFYLVDGKKIVEKLKKEVDGRLRQIALKILFYKLGQKIALQDGQEALVTGEALAQKSSQTLTSLSFIDAQAGMLVLRPLVGMNKNEIVKIAREIGTLPASEKVKEYCNLAEGKVSTAPSEKDLLGIPDFSMDVENAVIKVYSGIAEVEEEKATADLSGEFLTVDIRAKHLQEENPLGADLSLPYPFVLEELDTFKKDKKYLVICDFGAKSENIAYLLQKKGITAVGINLKNYLKYFKNNIKKSV